MPWPPRSTSSSNPSSGSPRGLAAVALALLGVALCGASCPRGPRARDGRRVVLVATAALQGQLEPFCTPERTGAGLARAAARLARVRAEAPGALWVDAGDALFGRTDLTDEDLPQAERRARAIAEAYTRMGIDAFAAGERDLLRGPAFLRSLGLRSLLDAGRGPADAPAATLLRSGGVQVAVVAAGGREAAPRLAAQAEQARQAGAELVVALVHATAQDALVLAEQLPPGAVDLAIAGHAASELAADAAVLAGRVPVFQLPARGRALLRLEIVPGERGAGRVVAFPSAEERADAAARVEAQLREAEAAFEGPVREARVRALAQRLEEARREPEVPDGAGAVAWRLLRLERGEAEDAAVAEIARRYAKDVEALPAARDCGAPRVGQAAFLGARGACQGCHAPAFAGWERSAHASALEPLARAGRARDPECARCHLTGLFAAGAACRLEERERLGGVQCEACHGPASAHAEAPARGALLAPTEQACRACHTPDHDPGFHFERSRAKILGPGHGESR